MGEEPAEEPLQMVGSPPTQPCQLFSLPQSDIIPSHRHHHPGATTLPTSTTFDADTRYAFAPSPDPDDDLVYRIQIVIQFPDGQALSVDRCVDWTPIGVLTR